jgi:plastocyanin
MKSSRVPAAALIVAALAAGCGGDAPAQRVPPPDAKRVDESKAGTIAGRVLFEGPDPGSATLKIDDAFCSRANRDGVPAENLVVDNGGLNNAFVYIKDGLEQYYFEIPTEPVKLDQHSCRYTPHVLGVRAGQPLEISNSDATVHNVTAVTKVNRAFNFSQPIQGLKNTTVFEEPEVMVRLRCDVHGWMNAFAGVLPHPYFAVTRDGGKFELKNVPAGTYTIEAWHEKLGVQTQHVTLGERESKDLSFAFTSQPTAP